MINIVNQFRRIFSDDGRDDRDFSDQEERLRQAQLHLKEAADGLARAASILADLIKARQ